MIFSLLIMTRVIIFSVSTNTHIISVLNEFYFEVSLSIIVLLLPFISYQVWGKYPFQSFKERKNVSTIISGDNNVINIKDGNKNINEYHEIESGIGILTQLVINAEALSNKIYHRSGIYLIFGVLIAFSGILFFSFQNISIQNEKDIGTLLFLFLPKFGILFFIEFIAFFFLKQYRAAMNEFKYYEEIKRNRESQLTLYLMALKDFNEKDFFKIINEMNFFKNVGVLSKGETTETIEASKLNDNEANKIIRELIDLIKVSKSEKSKS